MRYILRLVKNIIKNIIYLFTCRKWWELFGLARLLLDYIYINKSVLFDLSWYIENHP